MPEDRKRISRRSFLKATSAGLAVLASERLRGQETASTTPSATRTRPVDPVVLRSRTLELILDRQDGLPFEYRFLSGNIILRGEDSGVPAKATICDQAQWKFPSLPLSATTVKATNAQADFHFQVINNCKSAVSFTLRYKVDDATLYITSEDVHEAEGYELIQVDLPRLVTVREEDGDAWIAHGDSGGSLAFLKEATPGRLRPNTFWGDVLASLPVVMLGNDRALCVQEVTAYMDETILAVEGESGRRRASMGTNKIHRVNGSLSYDMNTGPGTPRVSGNSTTPNLLVGQKSSCRLDFITKNGEAVDWLDGARLVRSRMPAKPTHYYDDKLVYGIRCDEQI